MLPPKITLEVEPFPPPPSSAEKPRSSPPPPFPGTGDPTYRLASDPDDHGHPILQDGRIVGHSEYFWENFVAAVNTLHALTVSPRAFALLLDAMGGLALEHVAKIAVARLGEPEG